jgi:hypothetical protein
MAIAFTMYVRALVRLKMRAPCWRGLRGQVGRAAGKATQGVLEGTSNLIDAAGQSLGTLPGTSAGTG